MRREHVELPVPGADAALGLIAYGHYGRPVIVFPSEAGRAWDFENNGMVDAVGNLLDAGRVKLYCVDSLDGYSWSDTSVDIEERARRNGVYIDWLVHEAVPWVQRDTGGGGELIALGASLGAYHAVNLALQRADLVPLAIGLSGNYDVTTWRAWGERGDATYFANPTDYVAWEVNPTGALPSTRRMAALLKSKGIRCELDLWGYDVAHDWPWWQRQLAHHLPRFC
jgi:esterase/lipase superfamily enzyme